jgi:hypothetical protein
LSSIRNCLCYVDFVQCYVGYVFLSRYRQLCKAIYKHTNTCTRFYQTCARVGVFVYNPIDYVLGMDNIKNCAKCSTFKITSFERGPGFDSTQPIISREISTTPQNHSLSFRAELTEHWTLLRTLRVLQLPSWSSIAVADYCLPASTIPPCYLRTDTRHLDN